MSDLSGRVALVTGGGRGIGEAVAKALSRSGAAVAIVARSADEIARVAEQITASGGRALAKQADLADRETLERTVTEVVNTLGDVDILVNNAAIVGPLGAFATIDAEEWAYACMVNVIAPMRLTRAVLPSMISRGWGRIVNVSTGAVTNLSRNDAYNAYVTTKAGLEAHTLNLAAELALSGVTVNALRPGIVDTQMQTHIRSQDPDVVGRSFHQRFLQRYLDGTLLPPEAPAQMLLELVQSDRNGEIVSTTAS